MLTAKFEKDRAGADAPQVRRGALTKRRRCQVEELATLVNPVPV